MIFAQPCPWISLCTDHTWSVISGLSDTLLAALRVLLTSAVVLVGSLRRSCATITCRFMELILVEIRPRQRDSSAIPTGKEQSNYIRLTYLIGLRLGHLTQQLRFCPVLAPSVAEKMRVFLTQLAT